LAPTPAPTEPTQPAQPKQPTPQPDATAATEPEAIATEPAPTRPPAPTETFPARDVTTEASASTGSSSLPIIIGAAIVVGLGALLLSR
jgi:uncharacterized membrane protein